MSDAPAMQRVRALHRGYFGGLVRERGDVFEVPHGMKASWWEADKGRAAPADPAAAPADAPAAPRKAGGKAKPETVTAPVAAPFIDAPQPVRVENEVNAATGGTQPDWVAPAGGPAGGDI